ncbi:polysulfide reductase NrfD family protein [Desulfogranum mediterraneum]|uniref:polysulfide reductase n=1 Tax=Desulfogranum mediterraneum TaxID=160661 RepID=UPI000424C12B|nr:polysulfide reductase [Desulfogranum mediterraneum]
MKSIATTSQEIPIDDHARVDGSSWALKDKLWLGLSREEYKAMIVRNPVNWALFIILAIGIPLTIMRYFGGLDTVTNASNEYPWGLFLGFGLFGMVPLSASGFLLGTTVEIFGRKDFVPIERLALLNGLLGYFFAVIYLEVDLGMPWRLPYPMFVSLGPAAVLFLVAWHVATYLSVQVAEILPALFEWIGWLKGKRWIKSITIGLTIAGIILSTLHQGALGALFTYAPTKIHPLWISTNFIWIHFFCSAIFAGLSMVIIVSTMCKNFMTWRCDDRFLSNLDRITIGLGKGCAYAMITYLVIKVVAIAHDNEWIYLLTGWGQYYLAELGLGVVLPLLLFSFGVKNQKAGIIRLAAFIAVAGIVWNRLNTALICFNWKLYQEIPRWQEVWITLTVFAIYFMVYRFILYRLPILYEWKGDK